MLFISKVSTTSPNSVCLQTRHNINMQSKRSVQAGFTLIELMISLMLGLLITAAVMQVYLSSARTAVIQEAGANILDANIFGLQRVERKIRLANLGMSDAITADKQISGIVFDPSTNLDGITLTGGVPVPEALLTRDTLHTVGTTPQWTGASHTDHKSDQITIQYRAPQRTVDCEGQVALGPREVGVNAVDTVIEGQIIIERYYLREVGDKLALACDAGRYIIEDMDDYTEQGDSATPITVFDAPNIIKEFGDAGTVLVENVDDFQVVLGVSTPEGVIYMTSVDYMDEDFTPTVGNPIPYRQFPIVAVKIGIISGGDTALPRMSDNDEEAPLAFELLGETTTIQSSGGGTAPANVIRQAYEGTIGLRNANQL